MAITVAIALGGCANMGENETTGTVIGGGGVTLGASKIGKRTGKDAMTAMGAIIEATIADQVGTALAVTSQQAQARA